MLMKRVLITGGLGFIGSHLTEHLLQHDSCSIDIVDNLANHSVEPEEIKKLEGAHKISNVHTCSVEEFDFSNMQDAKKYDEIYHLASPVGPAGVLKYAGKMGQIILNDTMKVAEYASKVGSKVIFVSTSEVYGKDPGSYAQHEDIDKVVPAKITTRLEYGAAKLLTEICLHNFAKHSPLKYNIVRPFNIVGVRQSSKAGFLLPRLAYLALTNQPITVFGSGSQRRTFTHVKDIVNGFVLLMDADLPNNEIFNIGNPANEYSVLEVAKIVKEMTGTSAEVVHVDPKDVYGKDYEEAWNKIPDITKIYSAVGWRPQYPFHAIVQEIIDDCKKMIVENKLRPNHGI